MLVPVSAVLAKSVSSILLVCVVSVQCRTYDFFGGVITWRATGANQTVEIYYRSSWNSFQCSNASLIKTGQLVQYGGSFDCLQHCPGSPGGSSRTPMGNQPFFHCSDFTGWFEWSSGRNSFTYTFPSGQDYVEFGYIANSSWWLGHGSRDVIMRVKANLTVRADTGRINTPPTVDYLAVVMLQYGCFHTLRLPVYDADGDVVRCRWAESSQDECRAACEGLPNAKLDEENCTITYLANSTGSYAVAIQVEDYSSKLSPHPLSSVPLQFLVYVRNQHTKCSSSSSATFIAPTPKDKERVFVAPGSNWSGRIVVANKNGNSTKLYLSTESPLGMNKSDFVRDPFSSQYHMNVTWSRKDGDTQDHVFCFSVVLNNNGLYIGGYDDRRCVIFPGKNTTSTETPTTPSPCVDRQPNCEDLDRLYDFCRDPDKDVRPFPCAKTCKRCRPIANPGIIGR